MCVGGICVPPANCGNGRLEGDEACDDGNDAAGDGCSPACGLETMCFIGLASNDEDTLRFVSASVDLGGNLRLVDTALASGLWETGGNGNLNSAALARIGRMAVAVSTDPERLVTIDVALNGTFGGDGAGPPLDNLFAVLSVPGREQVLALGAVSEELTVTLVSQDVSDGPLTVAEEATVVVGLTAATARAAYSPVSDEVAVVLDPSGSPSNMPVALISYGPGLSIEMSLLPGRDDLRGVAFSRDGARLVVSGVRTVGDDFRCVGVYARDGAAFIDAGVPDLCNGANNSSAVFPLGNGRLLLGSNVFDPGMGSAVEFVDVGASIEITEPGGDPSGFPTRHHFYQPYPSRPGLVVAAGPTGVATFDVRPDESIVETDDTLDLAEELAGDGGRFQSGTVIPCPNAR